MKRLDRFILSSFIGPFFAILFVVIFILMMQFLWLYIDELVGKGLSFKVILEFLGWGSATLIPLSLPLATLLSAVMTLGTLGENNELLAIKAAGISLKRVLAPLIIVSAIISVAAFFASNELIPIAYNKIFTLRDDIGKTKEEIKIPTGTFYDGIDGYILRVNERDKETGMMHGVMVYNHTGKKGNTSLTIADSAMMKMSDDKTYLTFVLYSGSNYEETNTRKYRDTTLQLQKIEFDSQEMVIPLENYAFKKSEDTRFGDEVRTMNLRQLNHSEDSIGRVDSNAKMDNIARFYNDRSLRYHFQLDTTNRRNDRLKSAFAYEGFCEWDDLQKQIDAEKSAISKVNETIGELTTYGRERYYNSYTLRRIDVEILKKFALSLACFIFFFIGAPLGALIRKGGLGTPAIIAVLFFVLYWVIDITGNKLAKDGAVSAFVGVFISSVVLLPIGLLFTWNAINDKSLIDTERAGILFRKIRNKILGKMRKTRIVFMGTPEFAVASLDAIIKAGYTVAGVVTVADKASGRGLKVNESAVKKYAAEHNLPLLQPVSLKDPEFLSALQSWNADLFVVVAFRMLPKEVWSMPKYGTFNLHAALLPQYRGAAPINWAVINGEHFTGVTTFMINEGMDTGHIIFREQCRIEDSDNAGTIHDKLMETGSKTVLETIEAIFENKVELRLQKSFIQGSEVLKPAPKLTRELCHIDWDRPSREINNLIRGLSPYPAAYTELAKDGKTLSLKIFEAGIMTEGDLKALKAAAGTAEDAPAGTIVSDGKETLAVLTADGAMALKDIQMAGKKRMAVKDFLIGFRDPASYSVTKGTSSEVLDKYRKSLADGNQN